MKLTKEQLKDLNQELDTIFTEIIGTVPEIDEIEKKHLKVLTTLNSLSKEKLSDVEEDIDIDFLDTIVGES